MGSEIARIKRQIQAEYDAAYQALHGPQWRGTRKIITSHLERMSIHGDALADLVGNQEAMEFIVGVMESDREEIARLYEELQQIPAYVERFKDGREAF